MKRDMELVRRILVEIQSRKDLRQMSVAIDGVDKVILKGHIEMLFEAGMIRGSMVNSEVFVSDLSWSGHDFVMVMEDKSVWNKITQSFTTAELARIPLSVLRDVGIALLKEWAKKKLGLPDA
jgi:hypothetical protein